VAGEFTRRQPVATVARIKERRVPRPATPEQLNRVVLDAEGDLPGVYAFPREHWSKLRFHEPARSASTAKSVAAATSSASFPTTPR
jgi:hypothetical protein